MADKLNDALAQRLDLVGMPQKNKHIVETIRSVGYIGVMLNDDDFFNAVVWATNIVDRFEQFLKSLGDRVVIPMDELRDFEKPLVENAYYLLIVYYFRRQNMDLVKALAQRFMNLSKFQYMPPEHANVMSLWDKYMADVKRRIGMGDHEAADMKDISGTRDIYDYYQGVMKKEQEKFKAELRKEKGIPLD